MLDQGLGNFESESRRRYMQRRVPRIQVVPDLRKKIPGSICAGGARRGRSPRQIAVSGDQFQCLTGVA